MHVSRIGLTPLKGARHLDRPHVDLTRDGPVGDRVFGLVDRARGQVLRTVANPLLLRTAAGWEDRVLSVSVPGAGVLAGVPEPTGEELDVDYWGRPAAVEVVDGPWAGAFSAHLGTEVALVRSAGSGELVYGASVSLVTSSSLARLSAEVGTPVDGARFRATFTVDTSGEPAHVEDAWSGRTLTLGEAEVLVRGGITRCAVVDLDPVTGERHPAVLGSLGGYRRAHGGILFGVDAVVTRPGRVGVDSVVERS